MIDRSNAEEDLRIIRTLMERATIYRAISAPTALVGGLLAILAAVAIHVHDEIMHLPAIAAARVRVHLDGGFGPRSSSPTFFLSGARQEGTGVLLFLRE